MKVTEYGTPTPVQTKTRGQFMGQFMDADISKSTLKLKGVLVFLRWEACYQDSLTIMALGWCAKKKEKKKSDNSLNICFWLSFVELERKQGNLVKIGQKGNGPAIGGKAHQIGKMNDTPCKEVKIVKFSNWLNGDR